MNTIELMGSAFASLRTNLLRTILTMLGILIGVASIIVIVAIGNGGKAAIVSTLASSRFAASIQIIPKELVAPGLPEPGQVLSIAPQDFQLAQGFSGVASVSGTYFGQTQVQAGSNQLSVSIEAGPSYLNEFAHFQVVEGHMYTEADVIAHRSVALLSQSTATKLFTHDPLGKAIQIGGRTFQVIGITSSSSNILAGLLGADYVYIPATTAADVFPSWGASEMDVIVNPGVNKSALASHLVLALNIHAHNANAYEDSSGFVVGIEKTVATVTRILTLIVGAIAGIALVVGGVGVMNIMLVAVTERTQEIGVRMSLGASRRDILTQFLAESVAITMVGGTIGIVLGLSVAEVLHLVSNLPTFVSWPVVVLSFLFSVLIGVICGLYPANRASRLNPIDALRYE